MAYSCNPATWRLDRVADLRSEVLLYVVLWRSGVRTKSGINMVGWRELQLTRLTNEGRLGRGRKRSRQKSPCRTVVGSRRWIGRVQHSVQYNRTSILLFNHFQNDVKISQLNTKFHKNIFFLLFLSFFFLKLIDIFSTKLHFFYTKSVYSLTNPFETEHSSNINLFYFLFQCLYMQKYILANQSNLLS